MPVFPSVIKTGIGIDGEFGEGALLLNGKTPASLSHYMPKSLSACCQRIPAA